MKRIVACLFLLGMGYFAFSQANQKNIVWLTQYDNVMKADFEVVPGPEDKDAGAIIIYDAHKADFQLIEKEFYLIHETSRKMKILTEDGLQYAKVSIPYFSDKSSGEIIDYIEATSYYMENGNIVESSLKKSEINRIEISETEYAQEFIIPDVKVGSVIEYKYTVKSPFVSELKDWYFQHDIPVKTSFYEVRMVPFYEYEYILQGASKFDYQTGFSEQGTKLRYGSVMFGKMIYQFGMYDIPAFKDEGYITSKDDYVLKLEFQLARVLRPDGTAEFELSSWQDLSADLLKDNDFGKYLERSEKEVPSSLIGDIKNEDDSARFHVVVDYVKQNFRWNNQDAKFAAQPIKDFMKVKKGNAAELNLYLTGVLRAAGLEAYPVIISTRDNGRIKTNYPFEKSFNYVVSLVYLNNEPVLTDATDIMAPNTIIPARCINGQGLVVKEETEEWVSLSNPRTSKILKHMKVKVNPQSGSALCNYFIQTTNYDALTLRKQYSGDDHFMDEYVQNDKLEITEKPAIYNLEEKEKPVNFSFNGQVHMNADGEKMEVPLFLDEVITENPFKQESRRYPVDMLYVKERYYVSEIEIPRDYLVNQLPEEYRFENHDVSIDFQVKKMSDQKLIVSGKYKFKKPVYSPDDYKNLKYYYNEIIHKFNEKIVIEPVSVMSKGKGDERGEQSL